MTADVPHIDCLAASIQTSGVEAVKILSLSSKQLGRSKVPAIFARSLRHLNVYLLMVPRLHWVFKSIFMVVNNPCRIAGQICHRPNNQLIL